MVLSLQVIADKIQGELKGPDRRFKGIFTTLGNAGEGDIVIRHWIDDNGVKMALEKGVCAIITANPRGGALRVAGDSGFPIILVDRIEVANAFALKWTIGKFAPETRRLVVTGTNGKSTTTHMIYHILKVSGREVYTNTDSKSEFNTLIDPVVPAQIAEESREKEFEYLVIEVSEVQGWLGRMMEDHAYLMTRAIDPEIVVITNVALDHIGLVNSIDEAFWEVSGAVRAMNGGFAVLNCEDERVRSMAGLNKKVEVFFYGDDSQISCQEDGVYVGDRLFIEGDSLPFKSKHFIQNTLAAIAACICLKLPLDDIKAGVLSYKPLKRRFSIIHESPLIIDDFAHNPDGIKATVESAAAMKRRLWIVCAIRGSRGKEINIANARALAKTIKDIQYNLIVTDSDDVVDDLNIVKDDERQVFLEVLKEYGIEYTHLNKLEDALIEALNRAAEDDIILLIGAQGMDPASKLLEKILKEGDQC
ncbi:MAG TPA: Mur ligase family protein [Methanothermobacter sp.]|nr:UDP-N-acetylmuramyl-tripeptide synthetase [Methanothermobacter sp. MT-2]HHW05575.1 Mur ligase family protein [Methanothermobacter sp.]HOK72675.1 Mur ligase family protein [Methanothermobacter sp.]HOL68605.1 Mur ligase family protein [Methanothermobacter sp.]HPQ04364.1 Mur ligase family protein [Methanothermobacter sp.]